MFSALKFVVASVIVALFGGFLLAGILGTQQDDEVVPAAASASPGPDRTTAPTEPGVRSDLLPGVELTVDEVEPGVYRVVDDGVRDLAALDDIEFGLDGGLWGQTDEGLFRFGGDLVAWPSGTERSPRDDWKLRGVTPEGVVWTSEWEPPGFGDDVDVIRSYDGERWTVRKQDRPDIDLEFGPDGTVYGQWWDPPGIEGRPVVARYGADGWEQLGEPFPGDIGGLFADVAGDIWVRNDGGLSAYRDGEWRSVYTQPSWTESRDGIWVRTAPRRLATEDRASAQEVGSWPLDDYDVMTYSGDGWRALGPDDILRELDGVEVAVSPEGDLWTWRPGWPDEGSPCDSRPSRYDGERWAQYLPDRCVEGLSFAPGGSTWVLTGMGASGLEEGDPFERHELYVITPAAPGTYEGADLAEEADRSQTLDILPGVALNVEEVEPGIFHLLDDGVWDLSPSFHVPGGLGAGINDSVVAGDDGGVYVLLESGFLRLGDDVIHPWPVGSEEPFGRDIEVAEDGTVWVMTADFDTPGRLHSFDGDSWTSHDGDVVDFDIAPSGTVWVSGFDPDTGEWALRYSADTGASWQTLETPFSPGDLGTGYDPFSNVGRLAVVDDGDLWFGAQQTPPWHYRDGIWNEPESGAAGGFYGGPQVNRDGVLWSVRPDAGTLRRFDGSTWQAWSLDELDLRPGGWWSDRYLVAPDGSLWADDVGSPTDDGEDRTAPCPPLARFDGVTVQRFLPETCGGSVSLDVAADGTVWVASGHDLYVITPEAVSASEQTSARRSP